MPYKDLELEKQKKHEYYELNKERISTNVRNYGRVFRAEAKVEVLSHYGKDGKLQCCWPECCVIDPDMLSLDHLDNNGAEHRRNNGNASGAILYRQLIREGFTEGYQTLCLNHQFKKELMRKRELWDKTGDTPGK
jgi:hypothetical protein